MAPVRWMPAGYMRGGGGGGPGCSDASCTTGECGDDCGGGYCHCWSVFGEFLYMRARDCEVAYAVPIDGNITDPSDPAFQVGEVQVVDPDYQPGFRFGFTRTCSECSLVAVTYSQLDADANDTLVLPGGALGTPLARSLVSPLPIDSAVDTLDAEAHLFVQFKTLDVDYKSLIAYCDDYRVAFVVGARYAKLNQEFDAIFETNGFDTVATDVDFEGGGIKLGLEAERYGRNRQCFVYGKGDVALLGGESRATYFGSNDADAVLVDTSWKAGRMVTVTDLEAGFGWQNYCGNLRLSAGYSFSTWYNITRTNEWINAVQKNNFSDESDNLFGFMSFDGITARVEVLW
jgi:Legionella pneumophila major outer membrane protein precursor